MAKSANPNTYGPAFSELQNQVPDQFAEQLEFEDKDNLWDHEVVFLLLCNSSTFGVPVFTFLRDADHLDEYLLTRQQTVDTLKAIRLDYEQPLLEYKADEFHRLRKSLHKLQNPATETQTLLWFFNFLTTEAHLATKLRQETLNQCQNVDDYLKLSGKRLKSFEAEELSVAPRRSAECQYWTQLNKLVKEITTKDSNPTLNYLLLSNSGNTIFADANVNLPCTTMVCLLTTDEQSYIKSELNLAPSFDLQSLISKETLNEIEKLSTSRFKLDPSLGSKNYTAPENLQILDWIDADHDEVTKLIKSHQPTILHQDGQTREHDADIFVSETDSDSESVLSDNQTMVSNTTVSQTPEKIKKIKPDPPVRALMPEPTDAAKHGIVSREQQFLFQKKQAREAAQKKAISEKAKDETQPANAKPEDTVTTSQMLDEEAKRKLTFTISNDACGDILKQITARFHTYTTSDTSSWNRLMERSSHHVRFNVQTSIAKQIVRPELQANDVHLALCPSTDSIRYLVTVDIPKHLVLFNRIYDPHWIRWS